MVNSTVQLSWAMINTCMHADARAACTGLQTLDSGKTSMHARAADLGLPTCTELHSGVHSPLPLLSALHMLGRVYNSDSGTQQFEPYLLNEHLGREFGVVGGSRAPAGQQPCEQPIALLLASIAPVSPTSTSPTPARTGPSTP